MSDFYFARFLECQNENRNLQSAITALQARNARLEEALSRAAVALDECADKFWIFHCNAPRIDSRRWAQDVVYMDNRKEYASAEAKKARDALSDNLDSWSRHCPNCEALAQRNARLEALATAVETMCQTFEGLIKQGYKSGNAEYALEMMRPYHAALSDETPDTPQDAGYFRGYAVENRAGKWVFSDNGQPVAPTWLDRPCGYCGKHNTPEGHDACLGTIPGVLNACCGHGSGSEAYLQLSDGSEIRGPVVFTFLTEARGDGK